MIKKHHKNTVLDFLKHHQMSYSKTTTSNRSLVKEPVKQHLVHTTRFIINAASENKKGI